MCEREIILITEYRHKGKTISEISTILNIKEGTVSSFCSTHKIRVGYSTCKECGEPLGTNNCYNKYCSEACRRHWWDKHKGQVYAKRYLYTCAYCGREFESNRADKPKYCCHECYVLDRFGGGKDD